MTLYVPLWALYGPLAWLACGWLGRTAFAAVYPGARLGLSRAQWRTMVLMGPVFIVWGGVGHILDLRRAKRMRAQNALDRKE